MLNLSPTPAPAPLPLWRLPARPHIGEHWRLPSLRVAEVRRVVGSDRPRVIARYVDETGALTAKEVDLPMSMLIQHGQKVHQ